MYGYVGLFMAVYGCVWLCIAMYGYVALCTAIERNVFHILANGEPLYDAYTTYLPYTIWTNLVLRVFSYPSRRVEERTWEWGCVMSMMLRATSVEVLHKTRNFAPFGPKCWVLFGMVRNCRTTLIRQLQRLTVKIKIWQWNLGGCYRDALRDCI